jgi:hypothetical protein
VVARHVAAVPVDLIGLDQVGEHEAALQPVDQLGGRRQRRRVRRALVLVVDADAVEHLADLAHGVHRDALGLQLLHVRAARRRQREVAPAVRALERAGRAAERPGDHPPDGVLAGHDLARGEADRVQLGRGDLVHVSGDLQHRVGRRVDDQVAGGQMALAELLDHRGAAVGPVAQHAAPAGVVDLVDDVRRKALRVGPQRHRRDDAHQLPVAGDRVLARAERVQPAVEHPLGRRRHAGEPQHVAKPEALEDRHVQAAGRLGHMAERVRPGVTVVGGVREGPGAAGVDDDDERALHAPILAALSSTWRAGGRRSRRP